MKFTAIILLTACLAASGKGHSQSVTLSFKDAPLEKVFSEIEKQTGFSFIYYKENLLQARKVSLEVRGEKLEAVLTLLFKNQPLSYTISGKYIAIKQKDPFITPKEQNPNETFLSTIDVSGKVTDNEGTPLAGASVKVKGTTIGTTTNADGSFILKGIDENAILVFSYAEHETIELKVGNRTSITVALKRTESNLQEVVINKGYYTEKQKFSVGNVGKVTAKDIEKQPVANPLLALPGRVPGVFIEQANGLPGSGVTVRIQGDNSLTRGNDPLYIIDGVPYNSQNFIGLVEILGRSGGKAVSGDGNGNPLSFLNPADIESIEVLKDADATAIYGSRASAGAILITTKKGKVGKTRVDINMQSGWGKVTQMLPLMNTEQYLEMRNEAFRNDGLPIGPNDYDINGTWPQNNNTDWQKELIGGAAKYTDVQLSISGGSGTTSFLAGTGYHKETTVFPGDLNDIKNSLHFKLNHISVNGKFKFQLGGNYLLDNNNLIGTDLTSLAVYIPPNAPSLFLPDGSLNWGTLPNGNSTWMNPLAHLENRYKNKSSNLLSNVFFSYSILPGLEIKSSFGYTNLQADEVFTQPLSSSAPERRASLLRTSSFSNGNSNSWIVEPQASYSRKILQGTFDILLGATLLDNKNNQQRFEASGFNSDLLLQDINSAPNVVARSTVSTNYKYNAVFGRINYIRQNKYIINLTARRDGSSRFGSENLFHNFGSIAGGWIFSNENFLQSLSFLSFGKLKVSYGTTGNDQIGNYQFMPLYNSRSRSFSYQGVAGLTPGGFTNPYLQWEETKKFQSGIDLGFWNDRVMLNVTYYSNRSSNLLQSYRLPIITGRSSIEINFPATIQNYGWELSLNTDNIKTKNFTWTSGINITIPKTKLVAYENLETSSSANSYIIGEPFTIAKVFQFANLNPQTGTYQFINRNGDITSTLSFTNDRIFIVNPAPKYYGGFQNNFNYKGLSISTLFQFVKQTDIIDYSLGERPGYFSSNATSAVRGNQPVWVLDRWQKPGDDTYIQKFSTASTNTPFSRATASNLVRGDASFIRLKNVSISWTVPQLWGQKIYMQNLRLYIHTQNLLTITRYKGLDPETKNSTTLPPLRVITFGLQATF